jgi:hypothetical protein
LRNFAPVSIASAAGSRCPTRFGTVSPSFCSAAFAAGVALCVVVGPSRPVWVAGLSDRRFVMRTKPTTSPIVAAAAIQTR